MKDSHMKTQSGKTPLIVSYFLSTLMGNAAITLAGYQEIWILGTGEAATGYLAAYAGVATVFAWINAVAYFFAMGTGCLVASSEIPRAFDKANLGLLWGVVTGLVIGTIGFFAPEEWVMLLGAKKESLSLTYHGIRWMMTGSPLLIAGHVLAWVLRSIGKKCISSIGLILMGLGQIVIALILQQCGVERYRAVIGSIIGGQILSTLYFVSCWIYFLNKQKKSVLIAGERKVKKKLSHKRQCLCEVLGDMKEITKAGLPSLARQGSISLGLAVSNVIAGLYSLEAQSVMTAGNRFMTLPFGVVVAVCQAYQPIAGQEMRRQETSKEEYYIARRFGLWMSSLAVIGLFLTGRGMLRMIPGELPGKEALLVVLGSQLVALPFVMYSQLVVTQFQICRDWKRGIFLAVLRNGLFFVPVLWVAHKMLGIWGVLIGQSLTDLLVFPVAIKMIKKSGHFR